MNTGGQTKVEATALTPEMEAQIKLANDGSAVLIQALKDQDVDIIFGYPGGAVLPIYDALYKNPIKHVLARHEQGAIHQLKVMRVFLENRVLSLQRLVRVLQT